MLGLVVDCLIEMVSDVGYCWLICFGVIWLFIMFALVGYLPCWFVYG